MQKFEKVFNVINRVTQEYCANEFYHKGLNKSFLFVYLAGPHHTILVYDENCGVKEIAEIRYVIKGQDCFISQFETDAEFQGNGIGRNIFNFALAHADIKGATKVCGYANPTDAIKGVSDVEGNNSDKEKKTLYKIYEKLGCKILDVDPQFNFVDTKKFSQFWNTGEKYNALSPKQKIFVKRLLNLEKQNSLK